MTIFKAREKAGPRGIIQCPLSNGEMNVINFATVKTVGLSFVLRDDWEVVPPKPVIRVFNNVTVEFNPEKTNIIVEGMPPDFGMDLGKKYEMTLKEVSGGNEA